DRISGIREGRPYLARLTSFRRHDKDLPSVGGAQVLGALQSEEGDPAAVGREFRFPAVLCYRLRRAARSQGLDVDAASIPLGAVGVSLSVRREIGISFIELSTGNTYKFASRDRPLPDSQLPAPFAVRGVGRPLAVRGIAGARFRPGSEVHSATGTKRCDT